MVHWIFIIGMQMDKHGEEIIRECRNSRGLVRPSLTQLRRPFQRVSKKIFEEDIM